MNKWYENIPYGPLSLEDYERLASSFYDSGLMDVQTAAEQRGIRSGEIIRHKLGKIGTQTEASASREGIFNDVKRQIGEDCGGLETGKYIPFDDDGGLPEDHVYA